MLKHFAAATIGLALDLAFLMGAIGPAAAGKGSHYWTGKYPSGYVYSYSPQLPKYLGHTRRSQPNIRLDLETESVWRNLRPEWFD